MKKEEGSMAHPEHLELLRRGKTVWNRWRKDYPEIQPDLSEINTQGLDLGEVELETYDLRGVLLRGADFLGMAFCGIQLRGADLSHASLCSARFWKADLTGVSLKDADIVFAVFVSVQLQGADLTDAKGDIAELDGESDEPPSGMSGPFSAANLHEAVLTNAQFEGARFSEVNLEGAICVRTRFNYAYLNKANLREANLQQAELVGTDLRGADLRRANLQGAVFNVESPAWTGTRRVGKLPPLLQGANLKGANFRGADLRGVDLTGADFSEALVEEALF
jgi:uncharacterized protein YjbI with pentapeptide repeats